MNRLTLAAAALVAAVTLAQAQDGAVTHFPAKGPELGRLKINAATDISALTPIILDFQDTAPGIAVDYSEFQANDLAQKVRLACIEAAAFGDILISSAVDQMVKYANDGCAISHVSDETRSIPNTSTAWRDEVFGFTFEPAVIVYNSDFVRAEDVPRSRNELTDLLRREPDYFRGKVATYDLRLSGLGYLLAFQDAQQNSTAYVRLWERMRDAQVNLYCCSSEILADIEAGEAFIGYNVLGSYAYAATKQNPALRIVLPRDYTLILHRAAVIPRYAVNPELGGEFLDYLLSRRGQIVAVESSFYFSRDGEVPAGVDGPNTLMASGIGRTITIRPPLLATSDNTQRERFIEEWTTIVQPGLDEQKSETP